MLLHSFNYYEHFPKWQFCFLDDNKQQSFAHNLTHSFPGAVPNFESMGETLACGHLNESYWEVPFRHSVTLEASKRGQLFLWLQLSVTDHEYMLINIC